MLYFSQCCDRGDFLERPLTEVLAQGETEYQRYVFFRSAADGVCVALDGDVQSCAIDEGLYHEPLVHPAMLLHPAPRRVLIMGGGEGATAREALRHPSVERVVMVDIDATFVSLCREHLAAWNHDAYRDPRLELHCRDIHDYLASGPEPFDVVIGDLVDFHDEQAAAAALYAGPFYASLRSCLNAGAMVATQAGSLAVSYTGDHNLVRRGLASQFPEVASYALAVPSFYHLWSYVVASDSALPPLGAPPWSLFAARAEERGLGLPAVGAVPLAAAFALPAAIARQL